MCVDATERNCKQTKKVQKKASIRKRAAVKAVAAVRSLNTGWQSCYMRAVCRLSVHCRAALMLG